MEKRCYYEVLGVERTASTEEIRSAYRREALRWHPDKIQHRHTGVSADEAKAKFQAISSAYEVLSDPLERKWYDSHRSEILSTADQLSDFDINLWEYFSPSAYSGYADSTRGFYAVYAAVFSKVLLQEQMFARKFGSGSQSVVRDAPPFGGPATGYGEVARFYKYWLSFRTVKDYAWCDEYDLSEAPNRKVRRIMEEENKKTRKREQREFNEAVRQLAAFVRKRDKRVMERQVEVQRMIKMKEEEKKLRREERAREKERMVNEFEEEEWTKVDDQWDGDGEEVRSSEEREEFYCVACEKRFRSVKQWENHEKSRKHIERAAALKREFLKEEKQRRQHAEEAEASPVSSEDEAPALSKVEGKVAEEEEEEEEEEESDNGSVAEDDMLEAMLSSHRSKEASGDQIHSSEEEKEDEEEAFADEEVKDEKPSKGKSRLNKQREAVTARHSATEAEVADLGSTLEEVKVEPGKETEQQEQSKKKNRKKGRKVDSKVSAPAEQVKKAAKSSKSKQPPPSSTCEVCGTDFDSRNLLFKHIETTKHFALKY